MPARNARVGGLVEATPVVTEPEIRYTAADWLILLVLRPAWAYRAELTLGTLVGGAWWLLTVRLGLPPRPAGGLLLLAAAALVAVPPIRNRLARLLHRAHLRRAWDRACRHAKLATRNDRVPVICRWRAVPAGDAVRVRVPAGAAVPDLEDQAEPIAAYLGAMDVRVTRDPQNARFADVVVVTRDPLARVLRDPWPHLHVPRLDLWTEIPVGIDEDGEPVSLSLIERNMLIGGEPGAGKSVAASMVVATAALDPAVSLVLLDGKWVELAPWRACAATLADPETGEQVPGFVGPDVRHAIRVLDLLRAEMDRRYRWLLANGRRKLVKGDGLPLWLVVIDELALYLNTGDKATERAFAAALFDLIARGRAAGMIVLAATQRPAGNIVPTEIRDLFGFRWAFRCSTPHASDMILGAGWAFNGTSATQIDPEHRGVGLLLAEGGIPTRMRTFYLTDAHLAGLADRAIYLRASTPPVLKPDATAPAARPIPSPKGGCPR